MRVAAVVNPVAPGSGCCTSRSDQCARNAYDAVAALGRAGRIVRPTGLGNQPPVYREDILCPLVAEFWVVLSGSEITRDAFRGFQQILGIVAVRR